MHYISINTTAETKQRLSDAIHLILRGLLVKSLVPSPRSKVSPIPYYDLHIMFDSTGLPLFQY